MDGGNTGNTDRHAPTAGTPTVQPLKVLLSKKDFESALRETVEAAYYDKHPFHIALLEGELSQGQLQAWALNRYYFQAAMPRKDALLIAKSPDRDFRREWTLRLLDHDGFGQDEGGISRWLKLTTGLGLDRATVLAEVGVLPETRRAVDGYLEFTHNAPFLPALAASLTELFAQKLHRNRMAAMLARYDFLDAEALTYFKRRLTHAPRDASFALHQVVDKAITPADQNACIDAVAYKCAMLWHLLDALEDAYVKGPIPDGAFRPGP